MCVSSIKVFHTINNTPTMRLFLLVNYGTTDRPPVMERIPDTDELPKKWEYKQLWYIYVVNFDALAQASNFRIEYMYNTIKRFTLHW